MAVENRFVWFDLLTNDIPGAKAFYSEIVGWSFTNWSGGDYQMLTMGEKQYGGMMRLPEDTQKAGAPPHWMGYVAVDDVDRAAAKAKELGGQIHVPGTDVPEVGRFAVLADPQGASFAVFTSKDPMPPEPQAPGGFGWNELNTTDWKSAWNFYSALFGWQPTQSMDMGPEMGGEYFMFGVDAKNSIGGMSNAATMMKAPAHWLHYINVKNADEAARRVASKGGKVLNGPMDVPGGGRIAQCMDPQGGFFAIYSE